MNTYKTSDWLNLRSTPEVPAGDSGKNVLGIMPPETIVEQLPDAGIGKWKHIKAHLGRTLKEGYASALFLEETSDAFPTDENNETVIPVAHLSNANKTIKRTGTNGRAYPLNEEGMKRVDIRSIADINERIKNIHEVINWLDVEQSNRYAPTSINTYCNIYAFDVAYCLGLYLPRVWWNEHAFSIMQQGRKPDIIYEKTVYELNANALTNWFENYGKGFGWARVFDIETLQTRVNGGTPGIIVAQRIDLNRSGHIVAVLPEHLQQKAQRDVNGKITSPLQSQAGVTNRKYFTGNNWWVNSGKFRKFGLWVWESSSQ